jgi:hypothetical protein
MRLGVSIDSQLRSSPKPVESTASTAMARLAGSTMRRTNARQEGEKQVKEVEW